MESVLAALRAAAEPTRLRLLALCAAGELTVSELTAILGQSQPRVSRHLKLLCEAGLLDRFPEGQWVFNRLKAEREAGGALARALVAQVPADDTTFALDRSRRVAVTERRRAAAAEYFRTNAREWDRIRSLHVPEVEVERALLAQVAGVAVEDVLDVGTGTGRMLELFGPQSRSGVGVDLSPEMLTLARGRLERARLTHCQVRQADMYRLPFPDGRFDLVLFHQVLHYADNPAAALAEAARVLHRGGRLVVVDFAPHTLERLRDQHAHRRLGFADREVTTWYRELGLAPASPVHLAGDPLTVSIWPATRGRTGH
ncbi:MAG: metalloregulator ArsR/SmtB family transcription factor [Alphaproteobacteria bacterium]|nr:metalloregulator ArsR/SmtB family transcription factor [Alphaproteobacteria bacterium]